MNSLHIGALGNTFRVTIADAAVAWQVFPLLQDLLVPGVQRPDGRIVVGGQGPWWVSASAHLAECLRVADVLAELLRAVNLTAVASTKLLAVHAAVLAKAGRVVVLPAASGTGKSTLTGCLVRHCGWTYLSDEAFALKWDLGALVAYPRPMTLSPWSLEHVAVTAPFDGDEYLVAGRSLGGVSATYPGPVTDVVLLRRSEHAHGESVLAPAAAHQVLPELLSRSFTHFLHPALAMQLLARLCADARTWQLQLGCPQRSAQALTAELVQR